jgi:preprotein translocase subunit SecG
LQTALTIVQIILAIIVIVVTLLQTKGSGFSGAMAGDTSSIYRSRRGIEKTLFQFTIGFAVVFFVLSAVIALVLR